MRSNDSLTAVASNTPALFVEHITEHLKLEVRRLTFTVFFARGQDF